METIKDGLFSKSSKFKPVTEKGNTFGKQLRYRKGRKILPGRLAAVR
jgi:hypothetical protein